jgi:hypothetical protein
MHVVVGALLSSGETPWNVVASECCSAGRVDGMLQGGSLHRKEIFP